MDTTTLILVLAAVMVIVTGIALVWRLRRADIEATRATELVATRNALLVDVRSPAEFAAGHLDGAINIPVGDLANRQHELGASERPIIVYCASGMRSAMAKRSLRRAGFSEVYNLGGMHHG